MGCAAFLLWLSTALLLSVSAVESALYSFRLIHRFSQELKAFSGVTDRDSSPERGTLEYYQKLLIRDFQRQKIKLGPRHHLLFPYEGSQAVSFGNDFGWLHYTWIDIGTPSTPFLVALDDGSDLLWVPCNCIQCAPLSASNYSSLDRDLNEYSPARSSTSKNLPCGHELCDSSSNCRSSTQSCPYTIEYYSANTSSSGMLFEDVLLLSSINANTPNTTLQASIILGCGRKQSGGYLDGAAPDGLMGLGLGEKSVPSLLAKAGLVRNSFSLCFNEDGSGTIFFGDQGFATQKMSPFLAQDGIYGTYNVGVEACCIGKNSCLKQSSFNAIIDSGTSFTVLPADVYDLFVREFDSQVNATRITIGGTPWNYCYKSSDQEQSNFPSIKFVFAPNNSFAIHRPLFGVYGIQGIYGYCLTVQRGDDFGIIGQDFMTGYRMVFDREDMKLGWFPSNCSDLTDEEIPSSASPSKSKSPNPLPTNEEQSSPRGHAVPPAIAGKTPSKSSAAPAAMCASLLLVSFRLLYLSMLSALLAI